MAIAKFRMKDLGIRTKCMKYKENFKKYQQKCSIPNSTTHTNIYYTDKKIKVNSDFTKLFYRFGIYE